MVIKYIIFRAVKFPIKQLVCCLLLSGVVIILLWCGNLDDRVFPAQTVLPLSGRIICVDPGHGGYDPGTIRNGIQEKDIVLKIAVCLQDYLQQGGAWVVLTREEDRDFLEVTVGPKKRLDMKHRRQIIEEGGGELLISIHANCISSTIWRGAQVFYREGSEEGKLLASAIQNELIRILQNTDRQAKSSDYYILRETSMPGVIVEVGFLSNPEEAELLNRPEYQKKIAWAIYLGIISYLCQ